MNNSIKHDIKDGVNISIKIVIVPSLTLYDFNVPPPPGLLTFSNTTDRIELMTSVNYLCYGLFRFREISSKIAIAS